MRRRNLNEGSKSRHAGDVRAEGGHSTAHQHSSNGFLHEKLLATIEPTTSMLLADGIDLSQWFVPAGYRVHSGAQLE